MKRLAIILFSFLAPFILGHELGNSAKAISPSAEQQYQTSESAGDEPDWRYLARRLISAEDTLAQWIMAVFTVVASGLLWGTLREANRTNRSAVRAANAAVKMNRITREVGEKQTREYLAVKEVYLRHNGGRDPVTFKVEIHIINTGQSPLRNVELMAGLRKDFPIGVLAIEDIPAQVDPVIIEITQSFPVDVVSSPFKPNEKFAYVVDIQISSIDVFGKEEIFEGKFANTIELTWGARVKLRRSATHKLGASSVEARAEVSRPKLNAGKAGSGGDSVKDGEG